MVSAALAGGALDLGAGVPVGTERVAPQAAYCRSIIWETATTTTPSGVLTSYFTTYAGGTGVPLYDLDGNRLVVSQELRPTNPTGEYRDDFLLFLENSLVSYGSAVGQFSTADLDANGVPDLVQVDRGTDAAISGATTRRWPVNLTEPFTGRMTRVANAVAGTYSATFTTGDRLSYSGTYRVLASRGTVTYRRDASQNTLRLTLQVDGAYRKIQLEGTTTFQVNGIDTVTLAPASLSGSDGYTYETKTTVLRRVAKRYSGEMELEDGEPLTSWPDFVQWHFTVTDANDFDANGVPDLSDALIFPPVISVGPGNATVTEGQALRLNVQVGGTPPLALQWQRNGTNLPGATGAEYLKAGVTAADAGLYRVVATNPAGRVESTPAIVSVVPIEGRPTVFAGPIINPENGLTYYLLTPSTWPTAASAAQALGGFLATIPDARTQRWVSRNLGTYGGVPRDLWIGLSDYRVEGQFVWESGSVSPYRGWSPGEPNNCCGGESFTGLLGSHEESGWNDFGAQFLRHGVVEIIPPRLTIQAAVELKFEGLLGRRFRLQSAGSMGAPEWLNEGDPIEGKGGVIQVFRSAGDTVRFYRLLQLN